MRRLEYFSLSFTVFFYLEKEAKFDWSTLTLTKPTQPSFNMVIVWKFLRRKKKHCSLGAAAVKFMYTQALDSGFLYPISFVWIARWEKECPLATSCDKNHVHIFDGKVSNELSKVDNRFTSIWLLENNRINSFRSVSPKWKCICPYHMDTVSRQFYVHFGAKEQFSLLNHSRQLVKKW